MTDPFSRFQPSNIPTVQPDKFALRDRFATDFETSLFFLGEVFRGDKRIESQGISDFVFPGI